MNYWDILAEAESHLGRGDFAAAEESFRKARLSRVDSPGRVFMSETITNSTLRFWRRMRGTAENIRPGRWEAAAEKFSASFLARGRECLAQAREAVGANDGVEPGLFAGAIHLAVRSEIFPNSPDSVPALVRSALRAALTACEAPPAGLLDGDLPLDESDRVEVARLGAALIERLPAADPAVVPLTESLLNLLSPTRFALHSPLEEARSWWEAVLTDRGLGDGARAAGLYRHFLATGPDSGHRDGARVRLLEILANVDRMHIPVPRYDEARGAAVGERPSDPLLSARYDRALAVISARALDSGGTVWATAAQQDGLWTCVIWRDDVPTDVIEWREGRDPEPVRDFLAACRGRIFAAEGEPSPEPLPGTPILALAEALLEPVVPERGLDAIAVVELSRALARDQQAGSHPLLSDQEPVPGSALETALRAGRLWSRCLERVVDADPVLGQGIGVLARGGNTAAAAVYAFLGSGRSRQTGEFLPQLPPLAGRPAPQLGLQHARRDVDAAQQRVYAELADCPVAMVAGGNGGEALAAWAGDGRDLRVVLDRPSRLTDLAAALSQRDGMLTLLPARGPHDSSRALDLMRELTALDAEQTGGRSALGLFHWCRLVETHNGDLADFAAARRREPGTTRLYDRYLDAVAALPVAVGDDPWIAELSARAEMSATVVGSVGDLMVPARDLAGRWGVAAGAAAAWVFAESATVHWRLARRDSESPRLLHRHLAELADSHLSLFCGGDFLADELESMLGEWLAPLGAMRRFDPGSGKVSALRLAIEGVDPDAAVAVGEHARQVLDHIAAVAADDAGVRILAPAAGPLRVFLEAQARHDLDSGNQGPVRILTPDGLWRSGPGDLASCRLVVTRLESLDTASGHAPTGADPSKWRLADCDRAVALADAHRLCALEVNAILACGAAVVDIADARWGRRTSADVDNVAEVALRAGAESFGLPGAGAPVDDPGRRRKLKTARGSLARNCIEWMRNERLLNDNDEGAAPGFDSAASSVADAPVFSGSLRLAVGNWDAEWRGLVRHVALSRERGVSHAWLLCICDRPPAEADALLAACPDFGASVPPGAPGRSPVYWVQAEQLLDPELQAAVQASPPAAVFAADLRDWLPPRGGDATGLAMRFITRDLDSATVVAATTLPPAWAAFCREFWDEAAAAGRRVDILHAVEQGAAAKATAASGGSAPQVTAGRIGHPLVSCPRCAEPVELRRITSVCSACGLAVSRWLSPAARARLERELTGLKIRALISRSDLGADVPLGVWADAARMPSIRDELAAAGVSCRESGELLLAEPGSGRLWEIARLTPSSRPRPGLRHALLDLPEDEADLQSFRHAAGGEVGLWFHPVELAGSLSRDGGIRRIRDRYARLLAGLHRPPGLDPDWRWEGLMPARLVAMLTGLPPRQVRRALGVASWLAAAAGRSAADAAERTGERRLTPRLSFTELDYRIAGLRRTLERFLPELLAGSLPGAVRRIDLAFSYCEFPAADLALCDRFLLASSVRLGFDSAAAGPRARPELLYAPEDGVLFSARRRVGHLGAVAEVAAAVLDRLDRFAAGARELYSEPIAGSEDLQVPADRDLVATGIMLGAWRLVGPRAINEIPMPAEPPWGALAERGGACRPDIVLGDLAVSRSEWSRRLEGAWTTGFLEEAPERQERRDAYGLPARIIGAEARSLIGFLTSAEPGVRALRGAAGCGRMDLLVSALTRAVADGLPEGAVNVYSPSIGEAARFHLAWRSAAPDLTPPAVHVLTGGARIDGPPEGGYLPLDRVSEVCVILEAQDIPAEMRYRISQRYREGHLIATVEPVLAEEAWEHLFLATPAPAAVIELKNQRFQSRRIWEERKALASTAAVAIGGKATRREKGDCTAHWATNLNECLSFLDRESRPGAPAVEVSLIAPVADDIAYVGRAAAARGWLAVFAVERDSLLLPGNLEFVAAVGDAARGAEGSAGSLLAPLLPQELRREYEIWRREGPATAETRLDTLLEYCSCSVWGETFLAEPSARLRVEALVAEAGAETAELFVSRPLWEAWRRRVEPLAGGEALSPEASLLTLATTADCCGPRAPVLLYLCLGAEPARRHYRVLAQAEDRALVLYQERSPLPGDSDDA